MVWKGSTVRGAFSITAQSRSSRTNLGLSTDAGQPSANGPKADESRGRYREGSQALIRQMAQTAVCNRHHSVDQQLSRLLLLSLDRLGPNRLPMTRELIASMLEVRHAGVNEATDKLQMLGVIRYARGKITVLDRRRPEVLCCECCQVVKRPRQTAMLRISALSSAASKSWLHHSSAIAGPRPRAPAADPKSAILAAVL